jgi:hypothetical protein
MWFQSWKWFWPKYILATCFLPSGGTGVVLVLSFLDCNCLILADELLTALPAFLVTSWMEGQPTIVRCWLLPHNPQSRDPLKGDSVLCDQTPWDVKTFTVITVNSLGIFKLVTIGIEVEHYVPHRSAGISRSIG